MSDRINHAANSRRAIDTVRDWQDHEGETDATMLAEVGIAQAEATLALAEQQQIANLIALSRETFAAPDALDALETILELHSHEVYDSHRRMCSACGGTVPCATRRIIENKLGVQE